MVSLLLAAALSVTFTVTNDTPVSRRHALVNVELPLPDNLACNPDQLRVIGYDRLSVAAQLTAVNNGPNGSMHRVQVLFTTDIDPAETKTWTLTTGRSTTPQAVPAGIVTEDGIRLLTVGRMLYRLGDHLGPLTVETAQGTQLVAAPPDTERTEDAGPVRATVRRDGWLMHENNKLLRYSQCYSAIAGQPAVRVKTRLELTPAATTMAAKCIWLSIRPAAYLRKSIVLAVASGTHTLAQGDSRRLEQPVVSTRLVSDRQHPGWIDFRSDASALLFAVKDFWKRAPKALDIQTDGTSRYELHSAAASPLRLTPGTPVEDEFILWFHSAGESFDDALVEMNQPLKAVIVTPISQP